MALISAGDGRVGARHSLKKLDLGKVCIGFEVERISEALV